MTVSPPGQDLMDKFRSAISEAILELLCLETDAQDLPSVLQLIASLRFLLILTLLLLLSL